MECGVLIQTQSIGKLEMKGSESVLTNMLNHITAGNPRSLIKPVLYTTLANLIGLLPFVLLVEAIRIIFAPFIHPQETLNISRLWLICGGMGLGLLLLYVMEIPAFRAQFRNSASAAAEGRAQLAEHLRKLPLGYLQRRDPGDLANMMMGDFHLVEHGISHLVPQMLGAFIMPILAITGLSFYDWRLAIALFSALPVAIVLIWLTSRVQTRLGANHMRAKINAGNRLQEYLQGIQVIKAYHLTGERFVRLDESFQQLMRHSIRIEGVLGPIMLSAVALIRAGLTFMIIVGVNLLLGGSMDLLTLVTFLIIGTRIFDPLSTALVSYAELRYHEQAGKRIVSLLEEPIMSGKENPPMSNELALEGVSFGYQDKQVLKDINIRFANQSFTALVGPSGSGKSTVLRLIARFYDPSQGKVTLGGLSLRDIEPEALLRNISMVFQDVYLFQDTVAANIRFGNPEATDEMVEEAAKRAFCHDFIMKLPHGYDTLVGEGGGTLSGGEKQRISIARAILKEAPIILLDEATASLDPENEAGIQQAIHSLISGKTVIVIAHRLKTIKGADQIIVLNQGEIVERGRHMELLKLEGLYAHMWNLQQNNSKWSY